MDIQERAESLIKRLGTGGAKLPGMSKKDLEDKDDITNHERAKPERQADLNAIHRKGTKGRKR